MTLYAILFPLSVPAEAQQTETSSALASSSGNIVVQ
jgi:hypothetical protein